MKKKSASTLSLVLAAAMLFSLTGCASDGTEPASSISEGAAASQESVRSETSKAVSSDPVSSEPEPSGNESSSVPAASSEPAVSSAPESKPEPAPESKSEPAAPESKPPAASKPDPVSSSQEAKEPPAPSKTGTPSVPASAQPVPLKEKVIGGIGMTEPEILSHMRELCENSGLVYDEGLTEEQSEYTGDCINWSLSSTERFKEWAPVYVQAILDDAAMCAVIASEYSGTLYFKPILKEHPNYTYRPDEYVLRILWKPGVPDTSDNRASYTRPFDFETIKADMIAYGEELGMRYDPTLTKEKSGYIPGIATCESEGINGVSFKLVIRELVKGTYDRIVNSSGIDIANGIGFNPYFQPDEYTSGEYVIIVLYG